MNSLSIEIWMVVIKHCSVRERLALRRTCFKLSDIVEFKDARVVFEVQGMILEVGTSPAAIGKSAGALNFEQRKENGLDYWIRNAVELSCVIDEELDENCFAMFKTAFNEIGASRNNSYFKVVVRDESCHGRFEQIASLVNMINNSSANLTAELAIEEPETQYDNGQRKLQLGSKFSKLSIQMVEHPPWEYIEFSCQRIDVLAFSTDSGDVFNPGAFRRWLQDVHIKNLELPYMALFLSSAQGLEELARLNVDCLHAQDVEFRVDRNVVRPVEWKLQYLNLGNLVSENSNNVLDVFDLQVNELVIRSAQLCISSALDHYIRALSDRRLEALYAIFRDLQYFTTHFDFWEALQCLYPYILESSPIKELTVEIEEYDGRPVDLELMDTSSLSELECIRLIAPHSHGLKTPKSTETLFESLAAKFLLSNKRLRLFLLESDNVKYGKSLS